MRCGCALAGVDAPARYPVGRLHLSQGRARRARSTAVLSVPGAPAHGAAIEHALAQALQESLWHQSRLGVLARQVCFTVSSIFP